MRGTKILGAILLIILAAATLRLANARLAEAPASSPQSSATLNVGPSAKIVNVSRIGVDLGNWTSNGAGQFNSNGIMNASFEPTIDRAIVIVRDGSANGFSDNARWLAGPDGSWKSASFQALTGKSAGTSGTIASSQATGSDGLPRLTTSGPAPPLATGDAVSVTQTQTSGLPANWWIPGESRSAPRGFAFSYPWDSTRVANGAHTLVCKGCKGNGGTVGTASISVTVNNSVSMSPVTILTPNSEASVTGTIPFTCAASSGQVAFENLFIDSTWLAQSPSYPDPRTFTFSYPWKSTNVEDGPHTLVCKGYNSSGGTVGVATASVNVKNWAGSVTIITPTDGVVTGTTPFTCAANSAQVVFENLFIDSAWLATSPSYPDGGLVFSSPWNSANTANGYHTLVCTGYNSSGGTVGRATVGVTVSNGTPNPTPTTAPPTPSATPTPGPTPGLTATLSVGSSAQVKNVSRIGVNLGTWTSYGAEQFSSNVIMNPGFEPTVDRAIVIVQDSAVNGFSDNAAWLARPDGFWSGASFQVLTGNSAGATGTIYGSLAGAWDGLPWFLTAGPAPALATGDAVSVTQTQTSVVPANWWIPGGSSGYVAINTSDHRPGSPGTSVAELTLQSGQPTQIASYLDSMGVGKFLLVNGQWQLSFWARATSGNPSLTVTFQRFGQTPFAQQTVALNSGWTQTVINFNAIDTGPAQTMQLLFSASGAAGTTVRLDDVQLGRTSDLLAGSFRAEMIGALQTLHPGYLRDWQGQLGDTLNNRLAPTFARAPQRWQPDPDNNWQNFQYSLPDFLALCAQVGAQPWIVVPPAFYDAEWTALGTYLAQAQATYNFREIVVEFGDENWNGIFRAGSIGDPARMGEAANRGFTLLRAAAGAWVPLHLDVNGQFVNIGVSQQAITNAPLADAVDIAPYYLYSLDATTPHSTAISQMLDESDEPSLISQLAPWTQPLGKSIDIYEVNASTVQGNAPESQRDPLVAGAVSGTALASRLLTGLVSGVNRQCVFDLAQYKMYTSNGMTALWGIVHDLTASAKFRPTGLAVQMLNTAMSGDFYPVAVSGASGITAAAFWSSAGWSLAVTSANSSPVTVIIALPGGGTAPPTRALLLSALSPTSTNESGPQVTIAQAALRSNLSLTVPAYGFAVLLPPSNPP